MNATQHKSGLEDAVRTFWSTRPQRPRVDRKVAGVAAALANRYAIDPTLVRVAFVVAALFGGSGILFYLLGWLFLAQQGDEVSAFEGMINRGRSSISPVFTMALCLALIPITSWTFGGGFLIGGAASGLVGAAALLAGLYLLQRSRGHLTPVSPPPAAPADAAAPTSPFGQMFGGAAQQPSSWDPLGAAPFAWDLPDPKPVAPQAKQRPRRRRSKVGLVGIAVGLLTLAACLVLQPVADGWLTRTHIIGCVLAAIALTMVGGAFAGGGRNLIPFAVVLSAMGLVAMHAKGQPDFGDAVSTPTTVAAVQPHYNRSAGDFTLDLTQLPPDAKVSTSVDHAVGDVVVRVAPNADVNVTCDSSLGENHCLTQQSHAANSTLHVTDNGHDGPGGQRITLDVHNRAGDLEVLRG